MNIEQEVPAPEEIPLAAGVAPIEELPPPEDTSIEIDGQKFASEAEAFAFAKSRMSELKQQQEVAEAYNAGIKDSLQHNQPLNNVTPEQNIPKDNWEERFYADPKSTIQELREQIKQEVKGELSATNAEEQIWREFFTEHPDLDGFKEDVQAVLMKETAQVRALNATKGKSAAMTYLAQKTRTKFEEYMERKKPTKSLTNAKSGPSMGSQTNVTPKPEPKKSLSMLEQMRTLKESKRKKS